MGSGRGFIVLDRAMKDSWVWQLSPSDFKVAVTCLFLANWEDRRWFDGRSNVLIERGSFISSTEKIALESGRGITRKIVRGALARLERAEFLKTGTQPGQSYTVVTILNYDEYQDLVESMGQRLGQRRASEGPAVGPAKGHNRTSKPTNHEEVSEAAPADSPDSKSRTEPPDRARRAAEYLRAKIVDADPGLPLASNWTDAKRDSWARTLDLLHRRDGQSWEDIGRAINWLFGTENSFVIQSAESLRKKFGNVRAHMNTSARATQRPKAAPAPAPDDRPRGSNETRAEWEARMARERSPQ